MDKEIKKKINDLPIAKGLNLPQGTTERIYQVMLELFGNNMDAYDMYTKFMAFLREYTGKQIHTINEMENMYILLRNNLANSGIDKIIEGKKLTKDEREHFALLAKTLEKLHDMKYGKKSVVEHRKANFEDIRDAFIEAEAEEVKDAKDNSKDN